jgi:alkylhydroperoxidase family enzyme
MATSPDACSICGDSIPKYILDRVSDTECSYDCLAKANGRREERARVVAYIRERAKAIFAIHDTPRSTMAAAVLEACAINIEAGAHVATLHKTEGDSR